MTTSKSNNSQPEKENEPVLEGYSAEDKSEDSKKDASAQKTTWKNKTWKPEKSICGTAMEPGRRRVGESGGILFAVFLIFLGAVFLLNNFEVLPWSVWGSLWRLWPVFLILIGMQMIFGRSRIAAWILGVFAFLVMSVILVTAVAFSNAGFNNWLTNTISWWNPEDWSFLQAEKQTEIVSVKGEDYDDVEKRKINIDSGMGDVYFLDNEKSDDLYKVEAGYYLDSQYPEVNVDEGDDEVEIDFGMKGGFWFLTGPIEMPEYRMEVGQTGVETELDFEIGAGQGRINLDSLDIDGMSIEVGAGKAEVDLGEAVEFDNDLEVKIGAGSADVNLGTAVPTGQAKIEVGAGKVDFYIDDEVGIKVEADVGAGSLKVEGDEIEDEYESDNYNEAKYKLEIEVDVGAGSIEIDRR